MIAPAPCKAKFFAVSIPIPRRPTISIFILISFAVVSAPRFQRTQMERESPLVCRMIGRRQSHGNQSNITAYLMLHFVERNDSVHLQITVLARFPSFLTLSFEVFSLEANQTLGIRYRSKVIERLMQKLSTKLSTNEV